MENTHFCWFAPTSGDIRYVGSDEIINCSNQHIIKIAKMAEETGFNEILIPVSADCMDPIVTASNILSNTNSLKVLIAYKPGMASPQVLGTMINTLDDGRNRVNINVVQGDLIEARRQGLNVGKTREELQSYLYEWSQSLRTLLDSNNPINYNGNYVKLENAEIHPKTPKPSPQMFLGGGRFAMEVASEFYDYYLTFGDTVDQIRSYVEVAQNNALHKYGRKLKVGMGINVVARKTHQEALEACEQLISRASKHNILKSRIYYMKNKALGGRAFKELESHNFIIDKNLWVGLAKVRFGPISTIYGSYEEVRGKILQYKEAGIDYFSFTGYPFSEEVDRIGTEILGKIRLEGLC